MLEDKNPTTRRYPRTLSEAFPHDLDNAKWWHPPEQRTRDKVFFGIALALWAFIGFYYWRLA